MRGRVLAITGDTVTIEPERPISCFGCMQECKKGLAPVQAKAIGALELKPGQLVETAIPRNSLFTQAVTALLPPVAGFIAGFTAIGLIPPLTGDGPRAAGGVVLMFTASLCMYLFRRRFPAKTILYIKDKI
jgi:sigma-E factor negative regulatory protein RseC